LTSRLRFETRLFLPFEEDAEGVNDFALRPRIRAFRSPCKKIDRGVLTLAALSSTSASPFAGRCPRRRHQLHRPHRRQALALRVRDATSSTVWRAHGRLSRQRPTGLPCFVLVDCPTVNGLPYTPSSTKRTMLWCCLHKPPIHTPFHTRTVPSVAPDSTV
jgi:hypothetical protein